MNQTKKLQLAQHLFTQLIRKRAKFFRLAQSIIALMLTVSIVSSAHAQQLAYTGPDGKLKYTTYANAGQSNAVNTIPDFSYSGYMGGGVKIPTVPVVEIVSPIDGDDSANIQAAINRVSTYPLQSDGFRGAVLLTKGTYEVSGSITISVSGVVLRGEGQQSSGGTKIIATGTGKRSLIVVSGNGSLSEISSTRKKIIDAYVPVGARSFKVESASGYTVGDKVVVERTPNDYWINDLDMDKLGWTAEAYRVKYERTITAISGNTVTIDAPIVQALETKYGGGSLFKSGFSGRISKVGVENLRLQSDYANSTDENHSWNGVKIDAAENAWVRGVTAQYFAYSCVYVGNGAKHVTVEDCAQLDPKSQTTGGRKYSFVLGKSHFVLFQRCYTRGGRHDFVTHDRVPGPNVFLDGLAENVNDDIGPHHRYATGILFDNIKGGPMRVWNRGSSGTGHGWSGAQTMFWNCQGSQVVVSSPKGARNWGIGCTGSLSGGGYWESAQTHVLPRSLYLKQLEDRLGIEAVRNVAAEAQLSGNIWADLQEWAGEGPLFTLPAPPTSSGEVTLNTISDSYVRDGEYANTSFGTETNMIVKLNTDSGYNRESYVKFNTSSISGNIAAAKLRVYGRSSKAMNEVLNVFVYPVANTTWSGLSLTWNNKPVAGATAIGVMSVAKSNYQWYEVDVTSYVQAERAADRNTIGLALKMISDSGAGYAEFATRDADTNKPQLIIIKQS